MQPEMRSGHGSDQASFKDSKPEGEQAEVETRRRLFMDKLGTFLRREGLEKLLGGRKIEKGEISVFTTAIGPNDNPMPYYLAVIETEGNGRIFVSDTPENSAGMMHLTGVSLGRERWSYNFDGDHTTRIESPKGETIIVDDKKAEDMDGLRAQLQGAMPGVT